MYNTYDIRMNYLTHSIIRRRPKLERVDRYEGILGKKLRVKGNKKFLGDATFVPD